MVHYTLQPLTVNVGVKETVRTEVVHLVDVVAADHIANADLIPLLSIERKLTFCNESTAGPRDGCEGASQPVCIGSTRVIVVEYAHDWEVYSGDYRKTLKLHSLQRQAIKSAAHLIRKRPPVPRNSPRRLGQTRYWESQDARQKHTSEKH